MTTNDIDLKAIARATRASHYRIRNGEIELFRRVPGSLQIGRIENEQVVWKQARGIYPPEDTERL